MIEFCINEFGYIYIYMKNFLLKSVDIFRCIVDINVSGQLSSFEGIQHGIIGESLFCAYSPLEGVKNEVLALIICNDQLDLSVTGVFLELLLFFFSLVMFLFIFGNRKQVVPYSGQLLIEYFYKFILDMVINRVGPEGGKRFPLIITIFIFILLCNLNGLFPWGVTLTSQIGLTFLIAFGIFVGLTLVALLKHQIAFFKKFIIGQMALPLVCLLFVLEIISYCVRPLSLGVRIAANMIGGHALLHLVAMMFIKIIINIIFLKIFLPNFFDVVIYFLILSSIFIVTCIFLVMMLELGVAFIQAYIFTLLVCIYFGDVLSPVE